MKYSNALTINEKHIVPNTKVKAGATHHQRLFGLDFLRATSILVVLLSHTINVLFKNNIGRLIHSYAADIGVECFFVLSGFLIGTIIIKTHHQQPVTSFRSIKYFWINRWFRTLPNYYLILGVSVLVLLLGAHFEVIKHTKFVLYFLFLQNSTVDYTSNFYAVSWSLSIEEWFYLLFPLVLFAVQFAIRSKPLSMLFTVSLFIFLPLLARIILAYNSNLEWDSGFRKLMPLRLDSIGIGVLSAFFHFYYYNWWNSYKYKLLIAALIFMSYLMVGFYFGTINFFHMFSQFPVIWPAFSLKTYFFTFLDISIAMLLPFLTSIKQSGSKALYHSVTCISTISYSLYLIHPIVIGLVLHFFKGANHVFLFASMWIFSIIGSYILYNTFEKRMTSLRERFSDKRYVAHV